MSRKSKRNRPPAAGPGSTATPAAPTDSNRVLFIGAAVAVLLALLAGYLLYQSRHPSGSQSQADGARPQALASEHAMSIGDAAARVHVVEFLDPACETCAQFYPLVKQLVADHPGQVRVSLRHLALHEGSDYAVRLLEASRAQDKYWPTLEALLASQAQWAPHHTVQPDLVMQAVSAVGLDLERLAADMESPAVAERVARDRSDAMALKVTATPEYFVNGRPLPSFGDRQLLDLVAEELQRAY